MREAEAAAASLVFFCGLLADAGRRGLERPCETLVAWARESPRQLAS
jgi:hypothetical protein